MEKNIEQDNKYKPVIEQAEDYYCSIERKLSLKIQQEIADYVKGGVSHQKIIQGTIQLFCEEFDWDLGELWIQNTDTDTLHLENRWSSQSIAPEKLIIVSGELICINGIPGHIRKANRPLWIFGATLEDISLRKAFFQRAGVQSCVGIPLHFGGTFLGVLLFFSRTLREQNDAITKILEITAAQITLFIRKETVEISLRQSEERYRMLTESSLTGVYLIQDNLFRYVNPALAKIFGYTVEEIVNKLGPSHLTVQEDHPRMNEYIRQRIEDGVHNIRYSFNGVKKDGSLFFAEVHGTTISYKGKPAILGTLIDITKSKQTEEALRESETRLRQIIEHSSNLFYSRTPEQLLTYVSPQTQDFFDCEPQEALVNLQDFLTDHPVNKIGIAIIQKAIETGERQPVFRLELIGKKGRKIWVEVNESPIVEGGQTVAIVGSLSDITRRVHSEDERLKLQKAVDNSEEVIFITDRKGIFTFVNPRFTKLYGYTAEEVIGKENPRILKSGILDSEFYNSFWSTLLNKEIFRGEVINKTKDQKHVTVSVAVNPILDEHENIAGFLAIQSDITQKKADEEHLLRNQRLESLGTLAGGVAHDLNNVLAPILLSAEFFKKFTTDESGKKLLQTIISSVDRGKNIINQILMFARGISGPRVPINIPKIIGEMEQIVRETFPKSIEIRTEVQTNLKNILGDPTHIHQVLLNLCVNARDAMPTGGVLTISASNATLLKRQMISMDEINSGRYITICVSDTGMGIAQEHLDKIFDPFFSTKKPGTGTGLGLSTLHSIVKSHGGFVNVQSAPGKGTTFMVYFPVADTKGDVTFDSHLETIPHGNGETILLVDDEAMLRDVTKHILDAHGYHTITAQDGVDAVKLFHNHQNTISLVITDMSMPIMPGIPTIHALRKINPALKIISISGYFNSDQSFASEEFRTQAHLQKPYTAEALLATIHTVLTTKHLNI